MRADVLVIDELLSLPRYPANFWRMLPISIFKFGGSSVGGTTQIQQVAGIVVEASQNYRLVVVSSAMEGVTDALIEITIAAEAGLRAQALAKIQSLQVQHEQTLQELIGSNAQATIHELAPFWQELAELIQATAWLRESTARTCDRVWSIGEKLVVRMVAVALREHGLQAVPVDADTLIETDDHFGEASPLVGITDRSIASQLLPLLNQQKIPIVTGFCGRAPDGSTTTLGRGGSDLTATLIARALQAKKVVIWTDVDGVYSSDPRVVAKAQPLPQLNYREAAELSFYGAKVLHQRSMIPVARQEIPVWIKNTFAPQKPGTVIDRRFTLGSHPVKAISAIHQHALLSLEGNGMAGVPGIAHRLFQTLAKQAINVTMISQSSAESSICVAIPDGSALAAEETVKQEFRSDLASGDLEEVVVQRNVSLIAAVGLGMAHTPGVAGKVLSTLGTQAINVLAIAQGSSELNISLAVHRAHADEAVRALHRSFALHRLDTGEDQPGSLDVLLLGCGKIGRAFSDMVLQRHAHVFDRFGLKPRIVAVCDRSGFLFHPRGFSPEQLTDIMKKKQQGLALSHHENAYPQQSPLQMLHHALRYRLSRPVLVDTSDLDTSHEVFCEAFRHDCDVVTANKKPLAGAMEAFLKLQTTARRRGRVLKAEATVGAGLPIIDTLEILLATGDQLLWAEGCLSGTLAYLLTCLEEGSNFSDAVRKAVKLGYTEPDPVVDLSGKDVARKALILGRLSGLIQEDQPINCLGLVDENLAGLSHDQLFRELRAYDDPMKKRVEDARARDHVLRFVARVEANKVQVGLSEVPLSSPLANLRGTDNMIVFYSERYQQRPLVIMGPGAGIDVTAMGVLGDVLRIAAERSA